MTIYQICILHILSFTSSQNMFEKSYLCYVDVGKIIEEM